MDAIPTLPEQSTFGPIYGAFHKLCKENYIANVFIDDGRTRFGHLFQMIKKVAKGGVRLVSYDHTNGVEFVRLFRLAGDSDSVKRRPRIHYCAECLETFSSISHMEDFTCEALKKKRDEGRDKYADFGVE
uniref:Reverse transcriptase n=1 Tax=Rhabditophanes sp. KR3021 TaxID=114890 RepID=A0AC35UGV8_9BILA